MEVKGTIQTLGKLVRFILCALFLLTAVSIQCSGQPVKNYTIKNGKMYIELSKKLQDVSLDSFIVQFNLSDIGLVQLIKHGIDDSLTKMGWKVEVNNNGKVYVVSKPLFSVNNIVNPADKIIFTEKHPTMAELFPAVDNGVSFGYNRFKNKNVFAIKDSVVTFFLRNNNNARNVMLAGSFNKWDPNALSMIKVDSGWIAYVKIGPGKYWYKFIVDGDWRVDNDNLLNENDGRGNVNSVFYRPNVHFNLHAFTDARRVYLSGSFNNWKSSDLPMVKVSYGWDISIYLPEGTHTYRFVVDGNWYADPNNDQKFPNEFGEFNSVVQIGKPYLFRLRGYQDAKDVRLVGSFNRWKDHELRMKKTSSGWELPYVLGPGNYEYKFLVDGIQITDPDNPVTISTGKSKGNSYLIINPNYTFRLKYNASSVFLAGDFNDWSPNSLAMKKEGDYWTFNVHLSAGKHLYKYIVDGKWINDPGNPLWEQNEYGTGNSILWIEH